jgi:hypothetical protein
MSRLLFILDGPCFRQLEHSTPIFGTMGFHLPFTMHLPPPAGIENFNNFLINFVGRVDEKNTDEFVMVSSLGGYTTKKVVGGLDHVPFRYYYIFRYNVRTRCGYADEYTADEFLKSEAAVVASSIFGHSDLDIQFMKRARCIQKEWNRQVKPIPVPWRDATP